MGGDVDELEADGKKDPVRWWEDVASHSMRHPILSLAPKNLVAIDILC